MDRVSSDSWCASSSEMLVRTGGLRARPTTRALTTRLRQRVRNPYSQEEAQPCR